MSGNGWPSKAQEPFVVSTEAPPAEAIVETAPAEDENDFIIRRDAEIQTWLDASPALAHWKDAEMTARKTVSATLFPHPKKGTQRYGLNGGYAVKLVHKITYKLGDKDLTDSEGEAVTIDTQVKAVLDEIAAIGNEGQIYAERLVKWKPELSESEYKKLDASFPIQAQVKELIDKLITTAAGSPTLELEEPKTKEE